MRYVLANHHFFTNTLKLLYRAKYAIMLHIIRNYLEMRLIMSLFMRRYQENTKLQNICKFISDVLLIIIFAFAFIQFTCTRVRISGNSMQPTLNNEEIVLVNRLAYTLAEPKRYSVIAFTNHSSSNKVYVKRVIGLPGETVQIKDRQVYINDALLLDDCVKDEILNSGLAFEAITLGKDEYFVLGDNRNYSEDSRFSSIGIVKKDNLLGAAWLVASPISNINFVK